VEYCFALFIPANRSPTDQVSASYAKLRRRGCGAQSHYESWTHLHISTEVYYEDEVYASLPITDRDYHYDDVRRKCFDDADNIVLKCLFGVGEDIFNSDGEEEEFNPLLDNDPELTGVPSLEWQWVELLVMGDSCSSPNFLADWHDWLDQRFRDYEEMTLYGGVIHSQEDRESQISYSKHLASKYVDIPKNNDTENSSPHDYCNSPKLRNMHPKRWFLPFRVKDMNNHL
jgi:hypothetical protein